MNSVQIHVGDCLDALKAMPDNSVDSIVTDPPYGLSFMAKHWDVDVPSVDIWKECLRVLKPGGHLLAFAGTRTQHHMATRIEQAGFEIRDMIAWVYGSGFPKSLDVSKAIAKRAGGDVAARDAISFMRDRREELGLSRPEFEHLIFGRSDGNVRNWEDGISLPKPGLWADIKRAMGLEVTPFDAAMERGDEVIGSEGGDFGYQKNGARWDEARVIRAPVTEAARQWQGWGTALKPALEPITVARKPLEGTVAANVLEHGTGALNIDGCRVDATGDAQLAEKYASVQNAGRRENNVYGSDSRDRAGAAPHQAGRFPANLIHDGSDEVVAGFPRSKSCSTPSAAKPEGAILRGARSQGAIYRGEDGSAARFFYCAKASKKDRGEGNVHPTVKPTELMRYLLRLVTPPGGVVLDPFMGSGSTGKAAMLEGFRFIGCELSPEYAEIAKRRIAATQAQPGRPKQETTDLFAA